MLIRKIEQRVLLFMVLQSLSTLVLANDPSLQGVVTLSGGVAWTNAGDTQTIYITPTAPNAYVTDNQTQPLGEGELFGGIQYGLGAYFDNQIGIVVADSSLSGLSGNVWQDADPDFNNLQYSYNINQARIGLESKLIVHTRYIQPYISGSVGVGFNTAYGYSSTPLTTAVISPPDFSQYTTTAFTYTVGAGFQTTIAEKWQAGLGYEFADWGKSSLGPAVGQTINAGISLKHLYSNALLVNLTRLI